MEVVLSLDGNVYTGTDFIFVVPKDTYTIPSDILDQTLLKEDGGYFYLKKTVECAEPTNICSYYTFKNTFVVNNNLYLKTQRNPLMVSAMYEEMAVSDSYVIMVTPFKTLNPPGTILTRSSDIANQ